MEKTEVKKKCPFLNEDCIEADCALFIQLQQNIMGLRKVVGSCSLPALAVIMSSRPQPPPPPMNLSHLKG